MPLHEGRLIGKYRGLLIVHADLAREAEQLCASIQLLRQRHEAGELADADFAREFIFIFARQRAARFSTTHIRGMPGMIFSILNDWSAGRVNLRLVTTAVSAEHMLQAQAAGWRYVTIDIEAAMHGLVVEGARDAFEFALHDLGHAYAFFKSDYDPPGQVAFFQQLMHDLPCLEPLAEKDAKFASDLEYCMSDMNSHPQHLRQYLRGVIVEMFLRAGKDAAEYETGLQVLLTSLQCLAASPQQVIFPAVPSHQF